MAGQYLSGFGPRCVRAALDLFRSIYEVEGILLQLRINYSVPPEETYKNEQRSS